MKVIIRNVTLRALPDSTTARHDVRIADGRIGDIIEAGSLSDFNDSDTIIIEGEGLSLLPGLVDMHVHFRQPGYEYKETIASGSRAAAHGGFTTVCAMPNLNPAPDSPETLRIEQDIIDRDAVINVIPFATITKGRKGQECVDFAALKNLYPAGFSDDGSGIQDDKVMDEAMHKCAEQDLLIAAHCEVNDLLKGGYIHDGEYAQTHGHRGICSESEWKEIERNIGLAEKWGTRLHICHISTAESVRLIRDAKKRGVNVTCETAPHYLVFSDADLKEEGRFKMNPPIRSRRDREALIEGVIDGTIDVIATDHAPHTAEEKSLGLEKSAMGVSGIEASLPVMYTYLVEKGIIGFNRMLELMADRPREILRIENDLLKEIKPAMPASLTLVDFNEEFEILPDKWLSMGKSTPFDGIKVKGKIKATFRNGIPVFSEILSKNTENEL